MCAIKNNIEICKLEDQSFTLGSLKAVEGELKSVSYIS